MCLFIDPYPVGRSFHRCPDGGQVNVGFTLSGGDQLVLLPLIGGLGALNIDFIGALHGISQ